MTDLDKMARLPCPFCGSPDVKPVTFKDEDGDVLHAVGCPKCGCNGAPHIAAMDDPRPAAATAWNKRALPTAKHGLGMTDLDKTARELLSEAILRRDSGCYALAGVIRRGEDMSVSSASSVEAVRTALLTAPPGYALVPLQEEQWTDQMRDAGRAAVMAAQCATATWTPRQHYKASGRSVAGIPEDVLDERGPLTKESIAVMVMGSMLAAAPEVK